MKKIQNENVLRIIVKIRRFVHCNNKIHTSSHKFISNQAFKQITK